jgi:hypothetical protein
MTEHAACRVCLYLFVGLGKKWLKLNAKLNKNKLGLKSWVNPRSVIFFFFCSNFFFNFSPNFRKVEERVEQEKAEKKLTVKHPIAQ